MLVNQQSEFVRTTRLTREQIYLISPHKTTLIDKERLAWKGFDQRHPTFLFLHLTPQILPIPFQLGHTHSRLVYSRWTDISWSVLFNDTDNIKATSGAIEREHYDNDYPISWSNDFPEYPKGAMPKKRTAYNSYADRFIGLFDMPLGHSIIRSLHENLSPSVLSFLTNIREQSCMSEFHLCVHIQEGSNVKGDWAEKLWRHVDLVSILNATLYSMELLAHKKQCKECQHLCC
ncbi:hypothetical protein ACHAWX_000418 [Stephanocyclus meneghinianus]